MLFYSSLLYILEKILKRLEAHYEYIYTLSEYIFSIIYMILYNILSILYILKK